MASMDAMKKITFLLFLLIYRNTVRQVAAHDPQPPQPITIPALGRPFVIGALYDISHDHIVLGFSPWNLDTVDQRTFDKDMPNVKAFKMTQERFSDKAVAFGLSAAGKANFVGGLFKVSGSASFLYSKAARTYEAAVTFFYHKSTHLRQMTMEAIMEPDFPKMFQESPQIKATHVVTGIEYGANALFRISQKANNYVEKIAFRGAIKAGMDDGFGGDLSLNISVDEHIALNETSCEYMGDVELERPPITFSDALYAYANISDLINKTTAAAIRIHLSPLDMISSKGQKVRRVSDYLLSATSNRHEQYDLMGIMVGDMEETSAYRNLHSFQNHIQSFRQALNIHRSRFQYQMYTLLPMVRLGVRLEEDLARVLDERDDWYGVKEMQHYIKEKELEGGALEDSMKCCEKALIRKPGQFEQIRLNTSVTYLLAFTYYFYNQNDTFTECIKHNCISPREIQKGRVLCKGLKCEPPGNKYTSWIDDQIVTKNLRQEFQLFRRVYEENKNKSVLRHGTVTVAVIRSCPKGKNKSRFALEVYQKGRLVEENMALPEISQLHRIGNHSDDGFNVSWKVQMPSITEKWFINKYYIMYRIHGWQNVSRMFVYDEKLATIPTLCGVMVRVSLLCKFGFCGYVTKTFEGLIASDDVTCNEREQKRIAREKHKREADLAKMTMLEKQEQFNKSRIVLVGGMNDDRIYQNNILIYYPRAGTNEGTSIALKHGRCGHVAAGLSSGVVLIAGGYLNTAEQIEEHLANKEVVRDTPNLSVLCSSTETMTKDAELLDVAIGRSEATDPLLQTRIYAAATVSEDYVYVCGGQDENEKHLNSCEVFNFGNWANFSSMINKRLHFSMVAFDQQIYALGGWHDGVLNSVEGCAVGDDEDREWKSLPSMIQARVDFGAAVVDKSIFVCGGFDLDGGSVKSLKTCEKYNENEKKWNNVKEMLAERAAFSMLSPGDNRLYAIGGYRVKNGKKIYETKVDVYDPIHDYRVNEGKIAVMRSDSPAVLALEQQ